MTISTTAPRAIFNCDGVSIVFPVPIQAYAAGDFEVLLTAPASSGGLTTQLTLNSNYTLVASSSDSPPKWTLTTQTGGGVGSPFPAGYVLQVILNPPQTQPSQYVSGQGFPSGSVQQNFDRLTQMVQRLQDQINRAIVAPDGDISPAMALPSAKARALTALQFDANGNLSASVLTVTTVAAGTAAVASLAALRLLSPTLGGTNYALVFGNALPGDGGGGVYYYVSTDHATADNGGTVIVSGDGGRWYLAYPWK